MPDKLLIADDEPDIVDTLARCFASRGYEILRASSGEEAVRQAGRAPDLILLDVNMPDLNGLEVCRRIRGHVSCPIIFLTARVEEADKLRGFAAPEAVLTGVESRRASQARAPPRRRRRTALRGRARHKLFGQKGQLGRSRAGARKKRVRHSRVPLPKPRHGFRPGTHLRVRLGNRRRGRFRRHLRACAPHPR